MYFHSYLKYEKMVDLFLSSSEQDVITESNQSIINVSYRNVNNALHTVLLRTIKNFISGKRTLVIIPDKEINHAFVSMLQDAGLNDSWLEIDPVKVFSDEEIHLLRKKLTNPLKHYYTTDETATYLYDQLEKEIYCSYKAIYQEKIWSDLTWRETLDSYIGMTSAEKVSILHAEIDPTTFSFQKEELEFLKNGLAEAIFHYQRDFEIMDLSENAINIYTQKNTIDNIQQIMYELFTFKETAQNIRDQYYNCMYDIENKFITDNKTLAAKALESIHLLTFKIEKYTEKYKDKSNSLIAALRGSNKSMEDEKSLLMTQFRHLIHLLSEQKIILDTLIAKDPFEALTSLNIAENKVQTWKNNIQTNTTLFLKAANKLNTSDNRLTNLEGELRKLLVKINDSALFNSVFELNTLSVKKQMEFVSNLVFNIEIMMLRIEKNIPYYQWLSLLDDMDEKTKSILHILRRFDSNEWMSLFESWYHFEILVHKTNNNFKIDESKLENAKKLFFSKQNNLIDKSLKKWAENIPFVVNNLKMSDPDLYNTIIKKRKLPQPELWKYIMVRNAAFFAATYPIVISESDELDDMPSGLFSDVIYVDHQDINLEIMHSFEHIISFYSSERQISNIDFELHRDYLTSVESLSSVSMTERLRLVRHLANEMMQFGRIPSIYHLRHACVISFCSDFVNDEMNQALYDFGIKKLLIDDSASQTMIGAMLDAERKVFVCIENQLIDPVKNYEKFLWQRNVLSYLEESGCTILNIETSELLSSKGKCLHEVFNAIIGNQIPKQDYKNQLALELS